MSRVEVERAVLGLLDLPVVVVVLDIQDIGHLVAVRNIVQLFFSSAFRILQCSVLKIILAGKSSASILHGSLPYYVANKTTED